MARDYFTLVASLPRLPHFERSEWLPLSRKQIDQRLSMLDPIDARQLKIAEGLVRWQNQPITRSVPQMLTQYRLLMETASQEGLREFVQIRMTQRSALVALRRRRRGLGPPVEGEVWGLGPHVRRIAAGWDRPDLGISGLIPWVERADQLLESRDARELNRLMMDSVWQRLSRLGDRRPFGFEQVVSFVFRWDILQRWLAYDASAAKTRFTELIREVTREHQQLFH
ncbi:MAG: DUF2764 domain-containing protein [Myxococcota bacterium]